MQDMGSYQSKHHITLPVIIYSFLFFIALVGLGLPAFQTHYIYPGFINQIVENTETDIIRIGRNMMRMVLKEYSGSSFELSQETKEYLTQTSVDYSLWKVKVFSKEGETIYSTEEKDIGEVNNHKYFQEVVAGGQVFTQLVKKNQLSLEGQSVRHDVVETYIPILKKGVFVGAFELYYDVSKRKEAMNTLITKTNGMIYMLSAILLLLVISFALGVHWGIRQRTRFEKSLVTLATKDELTDLYNRRRFLELLDWEVEKFSRYKQNASLLLFDIDRFKVVNDTHGHQVGDEVIVAVAKQCQDAMRKSDMIARYGGEEFIAILPETDKEKAILLAERLRSSVESMAVPYRGGKVHVTISLGVAHFGQVDPPTVDGIIKLADDCLYQAKEGGRNAVVFSDKDIIDAS